MAENRYHPNHSKNGFGLESFFELDDVFTSEKLVTRVTEVSRAYKKPTHAWIPTEGMRLLHKAFWDSFRDRGPRHRNAARWLCDLGWGIRDSALREYLAPEREGMH